MYTNHNHNFGIQIEQKLLLFLETRISIIHNIQTQILRIRLTYRCRLTFKQDKYMKVNIHMSIPPTTAFSLVLRVPNKLL